MRTAAAAVAALVLSLLAACSSGSPSSPPPAPHLSKHTTCAEWAGWSAHYRTLSAGYMADGMGAHDTTAAFHRQFAHQLLTACQGDEHLSVGSVAAGLATLDRTNFS